MMDYSSLATHRWMIRDASRMDAFAKAIAETVIKGQVVLDVGAGCGVLSLLAARAGAVRVYAVERCATAASMIQHLAAANGFADVIRVIPGDVRAVSLPEQVQVIVSEWMGTIGVDENMLGSVLWARDHFLAEGGRIIPMQVSAQIAPVAPTAWADWGFFARQPYGLDLSAMTEPDIGELLMVRRRIAPGDLASAAQTAWVSDLAGDTAETVRTPYEATLSFPIKAATRVSALAGWFDAVLTDGVTLSNAPDRPDTHWGQLLLPLDQELTLKSGDMLNVTLKAWSVGPGPLMMAWRWQVNEGAWRGLSTTGEATDPLPPLERSELSAFLATLALDPVKLGEYLSDPDQVMKQAKLNEDHVAALKSLDPMRIGHALFRQATQ